MSKTAETAPLVGWTPWQTVECKGDIPYPRCGAASVVVGSMLYMFGGLGGDTRLDDFWCYDLDTRTWTEIEYSGESPGVRENNGMVHHKGKLYLFGGYNGTAWLDDFLEYDIESKRWRKVPPAGKPPASRFGYVPMTGDGVFLLFGGYDGEGWLSDMHEYSMGTETWSKVKPSGSIPSARSCPSWARQDQSVFVFGGYDGVQRMNDFYEFRLDTYTWSAIPMAGTLPTPRYFHSCVVFDTSLYLYGGYNGTERLNDLHEFSFATHTWKLLSMPSTASDVPCARSSLVAQVYGNSMFLFGGYNGVSVLNDFHEYRFKPIPVPPKSMREDLRVLINNKELSDVCFIVEGSPVYASRIHMAVRSEHFRAMLFGGLRESAAEDIVLPDISKELFLLVLEYLYTDEVEVPPHLAMPLLMAAERFLLDRLKLICQDVLQASISTDTVVETFMQSHRYGAFPLKEICLGYILYHLEELKASGKFAALKEEPDLLVEIIMSPMPGSSSGGGGGGGGGDGGGGSSRVGSNAWGTTGAGGVKK